MKKALVPCLASVLLMSASVTQAVEITYASAVAADGSGKTSLQTNNVFVETFDAPGGGPTMAANMVAISTVSGGGLGYGQGHLPGVYAAPANDTTYFAYGPGAGSGASTSEVNFNYTGLLNSLGNGATLNYLGLYYGSIDIYNDLIFYNAVGAVIQTVTGASLIAMFNGEPGNQNADSSNIYVNLFFTPEEEFTSFSFRTTAHAFEVDNLVVGYNVAPVPEPASLALLGLGLAGLGLARRRIGK